MVCVAAAYLYWWVSGVWRQSASWEVLPQKQRLFRLLPSQAVAVVLELALPPELRTQKHMCSGHSHKREQKNNNVFLFYFVRPHHLQLVQHPLHLLVDLIGR